jgi:hypothetical protein
VCIDAFQQDFVFVNVLANSSSLSYSVRLSWLFASTALPEFQPEPFLLTKIDVENNLAITTSPMFVVYGIECHC